MGPMATSAPPAGVVMRVVVVDLALAELDALDELDGEELQAVMASAPAAPRRPASAQRRLECPDMGRDGSPLAGPHRVTAAPGLTASRPRSGCPR
jgi:hypothetical protein